MEGYVIGYLVLEVLGVGVSWPERREHLYQETM